MRNRTSGLFKKIIGVFAPNNRSRAGILASATVEAVLVMPVFIYAVAAVMFLLQIVMIKQDVSVAAYNSVRTMAKYAYAYDRLTESDKEVTALTAYGTFLAELGTDYAQKHYIVGGNAGFVLIGTSVLGDGGEISVTVTYSVKNPFDIFGIGIVCISQTYETFGWIGDEKLPKDVADMQEQETVYITLYGSVYHTSKDCAYINLSITEVAPQNISGERNAGGGCYYPCEICMDSENVASMDRILYVTLYGDRFHKTPECSGLKRTIIAVLLSQVGDRDVCSKCVGR